MPTPIPADERRHAHDDQRLWNESYYLDWFTEDLSLGGYLRVGYYPNLNTIWYWGCLVGPSRPLVTVIDHEVALPADPQSLEIRHEGLWADHAIENPLEHMSVNLEAFAVSLDDPAETYHGVRGDRVPFGFELDFFTDRAAYQWPPILPRYEIPCRVHGVVLVGDERIEVDGWGQRDHSWGAARDWWANTHTWMAGRLDDGTRCHAVGGFVGGEDFGVAYELGPDSSAFIEGTTVRIQTDEGRERLPERTHMAFCDLDLEIEPIAFSPVQLIHPDDGREVRFPRALARFTDADGRSGGGWIEWNQLMD
jgi:hypothetical protein